jgi:hypothetical protein
MKRNNSYVNNVTTECIAKVCFQAGKNALSLHHHVYVSFGAYSLFTEYSY